MAKTINLLIDDQPVSVPAGTLVVDAAKIIGNDIPVFCYHPKMEPVGMCRMCLVDIGRPVVDRATGQVQKNEDGTPKIQFGPKMETACTTPVSEGMVVRTTSEKVTDARREILEFLLTSHPLDCPVCDKGGECPLQNLTMAYGPGQSRFLLDDKIHLAKHFPLGDLIFLDRERCIQCARCVRFQSDIAGDPVIGFMQRGRSLEIVTYSEPGFDSYFSGNTTDICPVGALTTADFRFGARPWELKPVASICTQCPVGCNLTINVRREAVSAGRSVVKRIMPRQNEEVNEIWICDKGRFAYHFSESPERITEPMMRKYGALVKVSWEEAYDAAAAGLRCSKTREDATAPVILAGGRLSNEDLFNLSELAAGIGGKAVLYTDMGGGQWVTRLGLSPESNIGKIGPETTIVVVASDLENEAPVWYLRVRQAAKRGAKLIVANARPTELDKSASQVVRYNFGEEISALRDLQESMAGDAAGGTENLVVFYGSDGLGLKETQSLAQACAALLISTNHVGRPNNGLVGVWPKANQQGAYELGFAPDSDLENTLSHSGALYIAAADPAGDDPKLAKAVESAGFVVVQELFLTATALLADVVLPVQSFTEREGTFTSGERRVQRFYPAISITRGPRPDFRVTADVAQRLGLAVEGRAASLVFQKLASKAASFAGLSYPALSKTHEQWPLVARNDLYYGGTGYENRSGLGVTLQPGGEMEAVPMPAVGKTTAPADGEVRLVPVTRLYDRGTCVTPSPSLQAHLAKAEVWLNPATAAALGLEEAAGAMKACLWLNGAPVSAQVKLEDTLPKGVGLVPRSVGIPLAGPRTAKIERGPETSALQNP
jgi:NADH-quinone oxidoreductase subunit G